MMLTKYNVEVEPSVINDNLKKIINQLYKLLPMRQQGEDWTKPLETIIEELCGMNSLVNFDQNEFFGLLCKLEGLFHLKESKDFSLYRRTIFDCLTLLSGLKVSLWA